MVGLRRLIQHRRRLVTQMAGGAGGDLITDAFNRADTTDTIGFTDTGQPWVQSSGVWGISSNQAYKSAGTGIVYNNAYVATPWSDVRISAVITPYAVDPGFEGLCVRFLDEANFLRILLNTTGWTIAKREAGAFFTVASGSWSGGALAAGERVGVNAYGTTITICRGTGFTPEASAEEPLNQAVKNHGFHTYYTQARWDDLVIRPSLAALPV